MKKYSAVAVLAIALVAPLASACTGQQVEQGVQAGTRAVEGASHSGSRGIPGGVKAGGGAAAGGGAVVVGCTTSSECDDGH